MIRLSDIETPGEYNPIFVVDNLLALYDLSILAGAPKTGKSTLVKYIMSEISKGGKFYTRECLKVSCIYYAYESRVHVLAKAISQFNPEAENIWLERVRGELSPDQIEEDLLDTGASFVVIDTLSGLLQVSDFNDYKRVSNAVQPYVDLVSEYPVHIMLVHHTVKGGSNKMDSILGSQALRGSTGSNWLYRVVNGKRILYTEQREMLGNPLPEMQVILDDSTMRFLPRESVY